MKAKRSGFVGLVSACVLIAGTASASTPRNLVTLHMSSYSNNGIDGGSEGYTGTGLRYSRELVGALSIDLGAGIYKLVEFETPDDEYTLVPVTLSARYELELGSGFRPFAYAGAMKHFITTSTQGSSYATELLSETRPAFGVGALWAFANRWNLRADLGSDQIGAGVAYAF